MLINGICKALLCLGKLIVQFLPSYLEFQWHFCTFYWHFCSKCLFTCHSCVSESVFNNLTQIISVPRHHSHIQENVNFCNKLRCRHSLVLLLIQFNVFQTDRLFRHLESTYYAFQSIKTASLVCKHSEGLRLVINICIKILYLAVVGAHQLYQCIYHTLLVN